MSETWSGRGSERYQEPVVADRLGENEWVGQFDGSTVRCSQAEWPFDCRDVVVQMDVLVRRPQVRHTARFTDAEASLLGARYVVMGSEARLD